MSLPFGWQIIALVGGLLALMMTVLPFTALIWGRPKISVEFDIDEIKDARILKCEIYNLLITKGILKLMCIRRATAEDVWATFSIKESGSQKIIYPGIVADIITYGGESAQRVSLPASPFPAKFPVVIATDDGEVKPYDTETSIRLVPGKYIASIEVIVEGKAIERDKTFTVQEAYPYIYWDFR